MIPPPLDTRTATKARQLREALDALDFNRPGDVLALALRADRLLDDLGYPATRTDEP